ncbi:carbon storage regulator (could also regulate swarming and quorum sensing) [Thermanaerovibrio velox DSM 12556]|uniref:Translational regulator CsrA n=1 Tax=Thermanaerovibrio velox DSM 12556 TaxID=926567 RepID=H0USG4_9BACT|nr:carbon storage regulator [Thermanaerovibrio velox]EHM10253.1 carbon storage regulator (could also regulate swarming and quorum sensing) [Thermanaerovibrio velox DSM 12556]
MLVLSRKPGESILIGDHIEVRCVEVRGDVVRLGIVAPRDVKVWRKELLDEVMDANASAVASPPMDLLEIPLKGSRGVGKCAEGEVVDHE